MITLFTAVVLIFLNPAHAESTNRKAQLECGLQSADWKGHLPAANTTVHCADWKGLGPMKRDYVHAMVVAAFREKRLDRRRVAMNRLETYQCEGREACKEFYDLLDWGVKSAGPHDRSAMKERGEKLRAAVRERLKELSFD